MLWYLHYTQTVHLLFIWQLLVSSQSWSGCWSLTVSCWSSNIDPRWNAAPWNFLLVSLHDPVFFCYCVYIISLFIAFELVILSVKRGRGCYFLSTVIFVVLLCTSYFGCFCCCFFFVLYVCFWGGFFFHFYFFLGREGVCLFKSTLSHDKWTLRYLTFCCRPSGCWWISWNSGRPRALRRNGVHSLGQTCHPR